MEGSTGRAGPPFALSLGRPNVEERDGNNDDNDDVGGLRENNVGQLRKVASGSRNSQG